MTNLFDYIDSILDDVKTRYVVIALLSCPIIEILNFEPKHKKKKKEMSFEKPVGEVFKFNDKDFVVVEHEGCEGCFFYDYYDCPDLIYKTGPCIRRKDGKRVIFKLKKEENDGK